MAVSSFLAAASVAAALAVQASCAEIPRDINLWQVSTSPGDFHDYIDKPVPVVKTVVVDEAFNDGKRNISYYPELYNSGGALHLIFSAGRSDVDGMAQDVRVTRSVDGGETWSPIQVAFPPALLDNQTYVETFDYYCSRGIIQRPWRSTGFVALPSSTESPGDLYAIAQSVSSVCGPDVRSAGRVARLINADPRDGVFGGDPCWIDTVPDALEDQQYNGTVYGTMYGLKMCPNKDDILAALAEPGQVQYSSTQLLSANIEGDNLDGHVLNYPSHAAKIRKSFEDTYWQRFWYDSSRANRTGALFVEYSDAQNGEDWYPNTSDTTKIQQTIVRTNGLKTSFLGLEDGVDTEKDIRVLVHNAGMDATLGQEVLTITTSRGSDPAFYKIGMLRGGDANAQVPKGTRKDISNYIPGFAWPSTVQMGDKLVVAYSENQMNVQVSIVQITDLP